MNRHDADLPRRFDPSEMALRGRIGAYVLHARHDARETTAKARESFLGRFEREVDPDVSLPEAERRRRAEAARKAYFARLALASARARAARRRRRERDTDGERPADEQLASDGSRPAAQAAATSRGATS